MVLPHTPAAELVLRVVLGSGALFGCGWMVARLAVGGIDRDAGLRRVLVALAWGFGVVPTGAFFAHLLTGVRVDLLSVGVSACLQAGFAGSLHARRGAAILGWDDLKACVRADRWPLLASAVIFVWWYIDHDPSVPAGSCVTQAAAVAAGWDPSGFDLLRGNLGDNRLGNSGVIAGSMAVFSQLALRMLYGLLAAMLALGGWLLARTVSPTRWAGWLGLCVLPLNPYVASLPLVDENLLALAFSAAFLPLVFTAQVSWLTIGALFGLCTTMRHPLGLALPAMMFAAWRGAGWRGVWRLLVGGLALTMLEHVHHALAFGSILRSETNAYFRPLPYRVFGQEVRWSGFLNWPLHDRLVRTPHNPYPMLVMWPLAVVTHLGVGLSALAVAGFAWSWRNRTQATFWLLWWAPVMAGLAVQEAWDYPNKMGVVLILFAPVVVYIAYGAQLLATRRWPALAAVVAICAALTAASWALVDVNVPADDRYLAHYQMPAAESPARLAKLRHQWTHPALWPAPERYGSYGAGGRIADLGVEHVESPAWGWPPDGLPPKGPAVVIRLVIDDIGPRLVVADAAQQVDVDLVAQPKRHIVRGSDSTQRQWWVTALPGPDLTVIELSFRPRSAGRCTPANDQRKCRFFSTLSAGIEPIANAPAEQIDRDEADGVTLRIPSGGVSLALTINDVGNVVLLSRYTVTGSNADLRGEHTFWHN